MCIFVYAMNVDDIEQCIEPIIILFLSQMFNEEENINDRISDQPSALFHLEC